MSYLGYHEWSRRRDKDADLREALALLRGSRRAVAAEARRTAEMTDGQIGSSRLARLDALLARHPAKEGP